MNNNPFILASGPPARNAEMILRAFRLGWKGAVTKTICLNHLEMTDVSPRIAGLGNGLKNIELISPRPLAEWADDIRFLKKECPDNLLIASVSAEVNNHEAWQKLVKTTQGAGADIVELNFSCPHGLPELGMGNTCSDMPDLAADIVKSVKNISEVPVWVKLSPNINNISRLARLCAQSGADGITAINTIKGFAGVDIATGRPILPTYGGISGGLVKPVALKAVSEIASSVNCHISAAGGISTWQDAVEFILLGASSVQICTEVMLNGYEVIHKLRQGLREYLDKNGYESIDDIRGTSLRYITSFSGLDKSCGLSPQINREACIKCGRCVVSCQDAGYQAICDSLEINAEKCTGCGLCRAVCPVNCIKLEQKQA